MTPAFQHRSIEKKWQQRWRARPPSAADFSDRPKRYLLVEFPYPSGEGLHVGHLRSYTALDIVARKERMEGTNVLYPMGWDAFGLPTENFAIKHKIHPATVTKQNVARFRKQMDAMGFSFDWSREVNTTDPDYYRWTQWIFLQLFKKGLAYQAEIPINWCPKDKIGLANEEVVDGCCERCGTKATKKIQKQWMLKITSYAERLLKDLDTVDYLPRIKTQQVNWIGKSEGAEIQFSISNSQFSIKVFTTRPDTLFGATYLVLSPEHPFIEANRDQTVNWGEVDAYRRAAIDKSDLERTNEKTGVELKGIKAINPATKEEIPIWVADFVLAHYGHGAVFADAHDQRDFDFAKKYGIPLRPTLKPTDGTDEAQIKNLEVCYEGKGILIDSGEFSGLTSDEAIPKIAEKFGRRTVQYKLRDWVFSRQHYWGEPIPIIHCPDHGAVAVPEKDLPVKLPDVKAYEPTDTGQSPLAKITRWVNTKCPECGKAAKRETDTMPNWAGSSWYYLRYTDATNKKAFADLKKLKYWTPVDLYNGGMEHTTLHLLYSRFWHKFLYDQKLVPTSEPFARRVSHGTVLAEDGQKMSKSRGNVVNPDELIETYGADAVRMYEMFMGPFDETIAWSTAGLRGVRRFLERVWALEEKVKAEAPEKQTEQLLNQTIQKVSTDVETLHFNTAVSALMIYANHLGELATVPLPAWRSYLALLAPFAPHLTEELWKHSGEKESVFEAAWPVADAKLAAPEQVSLVIQINGKLRGRLVVPRDLSAAEAVEIAMTESNVQKYLAGKKIKKKVFVPNRLVNFVV